MIEERYKNGSQEKARNYHNIRYFRRETREIVKKIAKYIHDRFKDNSGFVFCGGTTKSEENKEENKRFLGLEEILSKGALKAIKAAEA